MCWMPQHSNVIILQQILQASEKIVASEGGIAAASFSGGCAFGLFHRPVVLLFGLMGSFGWMGLLAHTRRPLPLRTDSHRSVCGHAARFRSAQWPAAGRTCMLQLEPALCILAVPSRQSGHYALVELYREQQGNKTPPGIIFPCARCGKVLFWMK